jgi:hypothetical protein
VNSGARRQALGWGRRKNSDGVTTGADQMAKKRGQAPPMPPNPNELAKVMAGMESSAMVVGAADKENVYAL